MKNPEIDVSAFLKGASPSFQKYIEEGLAEIQRSGGTTGDCISAQLGDNRLGKQLKFFIFLFIILHFMSILNYSKNHSITIENYKYNFLN